LSLPDGQISRLGSYSKSSRSGMQRAASTLEIHSAARNAIRYKPVIRHINRSHALLCRFAIIAARRLMNLREA
jgi:hypothetical protein